MADDSPVIEVYDQDRWAHVPPYDGPVDEPLAVVRAVRAVSLTLGRLAPADWSRAGRHPEHDAPYGVERWLELYAEHPHEHADQSRSARVAAT